MTTLFCMERCHVFSKNVLIFYGFAFGSMNIGYWFYRSKGEK